MTGRDIEGAAQARIYEFRLGWGLKIFHRLEVRLALKNGCSVILIGIPHSYYISIFSIMPGCSLKNYNYIVFSERSDSKIVVTCFLKGIGAEK